MRGYSSSLIDGKKLTFMENSYKHSKNTALQIHTKPLDSCRHPSRSMCNPPKNSTMLLCSDVWNLRSLVEYGGRQFRNRAISWTVWSQRMWSLYVPPWCKISPWSCLQQLLLQLNFYFLRDTAAHFYRMSHINEFHIK